jgi:dTDP-4-amino-4,6-dideoxygalactose transaminase
LIKTADISLTRTAGIREALHRLNVTGAGVLLLVDQAGKFERTVTDGDLRRLLLNGSSLDDSLDGLDPIDSVVLRSGYTRQAALELMNEHTINHLPVLDDTGAAIRLLDRKEIDEQILLSTPHLGTLEREFVEEAFRTNWIAPLGPNVDAFEREVAEWVGVKHAAACNSGTAAIHLALLVLGVERHDSVFCSALTFAASANPILYQGAVPVFIDSEPDSWNMSPTALTAALTDAARAARMPKAVIIVNLYGQSADMDALLPICAHYNVPVIEDAAESLGATYKGKASGTFGLLGVYSFNGNKIITTSGGGMLVSDDESLIRRAKHLATQAREPVLHYEHRDIGYNYRLSNILAGVGRGQLSVLGERVAARRQMFDRYREGLAGLPGVNWMPEPPWSVSNRWLSVCTVDPQFVSVTATEIIRLLALERIEARPVWKPMQLQPVFQQCAFYPHSSPPVSETLFAQGICLPSSTNITEVQQDRIIHELHRIVGGSRPQATTEPNSGSKGAVK